MSVQNVDDLLIWSYATTPERALLAAILERAVRDLAETVDARWRREAIQWFTADANSKKYEPFSFNRVVEELEISTSWLKIIEARIAEAENRFYVKCE